MSGLDARTEPIIEGRGLEVGYGGPTVLKGIDFTVLRGEIVALVGANGAGKTTLLRTISGLLRPTAGSLTLLGERVDVKRPERNTRRGLAHVPEGRALLGELTVEQNLLLARGGSASKSEILARTREIFPQLAHVFKRRAKLLSGGESQMLAVARALTRQPPVLIVDELSLGLSPQRARDVLDGIRRVAQEHSTAVLLVEQHVDMALEVAQRAYVLARGEIVMSGDAETIRRDDDALAAAYLGGAATHS